MASFTYFPVGTRRTGTDNFFHDNPARSNKRTFGPPPNKALDFDIRVRRTVVALRRNHDPYNLIRTRTILR